MSEAGNDFVEDQKDTMLGRQAPKVAEEVIRRPHRADVVRNRLDDDRRYLPAKLSKVCFDRFGIVIGQDNRLPSGIFENAGRNRVVSAHSVPRRLQVHGDIVVPSVIATLELDDFGRAGYRTGEAQRVVRRFRSRRTKCDLLGARNAAYERLGGLDFKIERPRSNEV